MFSSNFPAHPRLSGHHRAGNTLVLALGLLVLVAGVLVISTDGSISTLKEVSQSNDSLKAISAVEAILSRHERQILDMADNGSLADYGLDDNARPAERNYGVDYIGECSVRWKIEPCRTQDVGGIKFMMNPPPTGAVDTPTEPRQVNDIISLFRISAEGRTPPDASGNPTSIAQGARFVVIKEEPLFRYVIFYAQEGAKGDLEFTHDPDVKIRGNVHSNGSIYIGSATTVNDWGAVAGPDGSTEIGPDADSLPVRVTGVDGVFCLSKPLMFGALNGYPMTGSEPSGWTPSGAYSGPAPVIDGTNKIDPRRVLDAGGFHTNRTVIPGQVRRINGIDIVSGSSFGNDARDAERSPLNKWNPKSLTIFNRKLRSLETGGRKVPLSLGANIDPSSRPLEPSPLSRVDGDGDPSTDEPELSVPKMVVPDVLEAPNFYLAQAMGSNVTGMSRLADGTGWTIANSGASSTPVGLIIRERPIPETNIWPGSNTNASQPMTPDNPNFMPYAYGKHWYPNLNPFYPVWISQNLGTTDGTFDGNWQSAWKAGINDQPLVTRDSYLGGGRLQLTAACSAGPGNVVGVDSQDYFRENWRFLNLRRPVVTSTTVLTPGVRASVFVENLASLNSFGARHPLQGNPTIVRLLPNIDIGNNQMSTVMGVLPVQNRFYQMRFEAFVCPAFTEEYTFIPNVDDGCRVWLDGRLIVNSWMFQGGDRTSNNPGSNELTTVRLQKGQPYHLVVDIWQGDGGDNITMKWKSPSQSLDVIPSGTGSGSTRVGLFTLTPKDFVKTTFTSVVTRLDRNSLSAPSNLKAGLMIREGSAGLSGIESGRDAYVALAYNPNRGIITQRRLEPSATTRRQANIWYVGQNATYQQTFPVATPLTTVAADGMLYLNESHSGTWNVGGGNAAFTVTRDAEVTPSYDPQPPVTTPGDWSNTWGTYAESLTDSVSMDGRMVTVTYGFSPGRSESISYIQYFSGKYTSVNVVQRFDLTQGMANFSGMAGNWVRLYNTPNTKTTTSYAAFPMNRTGSSWFENDITYYSGWNVTSSPVLSSAPRVYSDNWVYSEDHPVKDLAQVVLRLNALSWKGRNDWAVAPYPIGLPPYLPNPGFAAPVAPAAPVTDTPYGTLPRTFGVSRDNSTVDLSFNSYVSSFGTWFGPTPLAPAATSVPRNRGWLPVWTTGGMIPPLTGGFPPDVYSGTTPPSTTSPNSSLVSAPRWIGDQPTVLPSVVTAPELWLRIERNPTYLPRIVLEFWYYMGSTTPMPADWVPVVDAGGAPVIADVTNWGPNIQIGPCLQSGDINSAATANFSNLKISTTQPAPNDIIDATDWDGSGSTDVISAYLASQYQVFWGRDEITEDFFSYNQNDPSRRLATEESWVNPREFWSQSRRWEDGSEKDLLAPAFTTYDSDNTVNRQWWAKSTFLTLNLGEIQSYIKATGLNQASVYKPLTAVGSTRPALSGPVLKGNFSGLIYAARTNRYPWNPIVGTKNPFSCNASAELPNKSSNTGSGVNLSATSMADSSMFHMGVHKLQPYAIGNPRSPSELLGPSNDPLGVITKSPPFKPQHFHHSVRLINGENIDWGVIPGGKFGGGKTTIVTPNQLFVQGDFNTTTHSQLVTGKVLPVNKPTPVALAADQITLLSNSFASNLPRFQVFQAYSSPAASPNNLPAVLLNPNSNGSNATPTAYNAALITNNQPTTRLRVKEGQGAPFIDTLMFLEKWGNGVSMKYNGSLVVIDTRRYTDAFLLDSIRTNGRSPFGTMGWNSSSTWGGPGAPEWSGSVPPVYSAPDREMDFNKDLLTEEGTPPYTPIGVSSNGLGGWVRVVK